MPLTPDHTDAGAAEPRSVLVVDASPLVCDGLAALVERAFRPDRLHKANTLSDATRNARDADLVITDVDLPDADRHEVVPRLAAATAGAPIVVITEGGQSADVEHAIAAGAFAFVLKSTDVRGFRNALESVIAGNRYLQPELGATLYGPSSRRLAIAEHDLDEPEVRLLGLIARGFTNRQSAHRENVSLRTIESRRARLQEKLGCRGRAELTRHAYELGLKAA
jgi:DNA-binding NarL/FixJ family response regulator